MDSKRKQQNRATGRFRTIFLVLVAMGLYILGTALTTMLTQRDYWTQVSKQFVKENITMKAERGNMLDTKGRLMVSTVPEYRIYMDYEVTDPDPKMQDSIQHWRDSMVVAKADSISEGLASIFPDKSKEYFRDRLLKGLEYRWTDKNGNKRRSRAWRLYPKNASYIQYKACKELPLLKEKSYKGGFYEDEIMLRKKPYGSLATRTLGMLMEDCDSPKAGLELKYDTILRGTDGINHRVKIRNTRVSLTDREPINGNDLVTTIDVDIQDIAEQALLQQLNHMTYERDATAELGMAVVMECKTGDVKAIVNMSLCGDGKYYEIKNNVVSDLMEPGSTFKTASIMVAIDDGKVTKDTWIQTGNGKKMMYKRWMKDSNWANGGSGALTVQQIMQKSSNVGVSTIIDDNYRNDPQAFVDGLNRVGMGIPMDIPIPGAGKPVMKSPSNKRLWYKTTLPWMSIGYESLLPIINTVAFYNGIANGGCMMQPRFVKAEMKDGHIVRTFDPVVLREQMCKPSTLKTMQEILHSVTEKGSTGAKAACPQFPVAGKTGTAQMAREKSEGGGGYRSGKHLVSFVGYFPSDNPQYTCMVSIRTYGACSGGGDCGPVFSKIAQGVMANGVHRAPILARDSASVFTPHVWNGNSDEARMLLKHMKAATPHDTLLGNFRYDPKDGSMPDVRGLGARDAVYALQQAGLKVKLTGAGHVAQQNIAPGTAIKKGMRVTLTLK